MILEGTIAAVASAPGPAPRAVIRLSGPLEALVGGPQPPLLTLDTADGPTDGRPALPPRGVFRARLELGGVSLPVVCCRFVAPASYTGQDGLELLIPGGPALVQRVMAVLLALPGVRQAEPGEFSARAYLAGRLTVDQARGVEAVIAAGQRAQLLAARRLLDGSFGEQVRRCSQRVAELLALVEAGIDFSDQDDVTAIEPAALRDQAAELSAQIGGWLGSASGAGVPLGLPRVVLTGPPSAGKSTLFNALLGRARSLTDAQPGTTRDEIEEPWTVAPGVEALLVDTPGVQGPEAEWPAADLWLVCDERGAFDPRSLMGRACVAVRTKADRGPTPAGSIGVCGLSGAGLDELRGEVARRLAAGDEDSGLPTAVGARLHAARRALGRAERLAEHDGRAAELIAGELRAALDELGVIVGRVDPDAVLGLVFGSFCVGK